MSIIPISSNQVSSIVTKSNEGRNTSSSASKTTGTEGSDIYENSVAATYTRDQATIDGIRMQVESKVGTLRSTVQYLFSMQSARYDESQGVSIDEIISKYQGNLKSFFESLTVDPKTSAQAKLDISEDGFWGVKQTSQRTLDFAMALSGGDPEKFDELKQAILKGYQQAEDAWGGALPDICKQTRDAIISGLNDLTNEN